MKVLYSFGLPFLILFVPHLTQLLASQEAAPQLKILIHDQKKIYTWNDQVRYSISVVDLKDGDSKYGEIPSQECSLTLTYVPPDKQKDVQK